MKIIGLVGKKGAGKTTLAKEIYNWLPKDCKCYNLSFASTLKSMMLKADICTERELYSEKTMFSRSMMQKIGTGIIREQIDKDFFCRALLKEIRAIYEFSNDSVIIIDDVRFQNEKSLITQIKGVLIKVIRPCLLEEDKHKSEMEVDKIEASITIFNDSDIENLSLAARGICTFLPAFKNTSASDLIGAL